MPKKKIVSMEGRRRRKPRAVNMSFQDLSQNRISLDELESRFGWIRFWDTILADVLLAETEAAA